MFYKPSLYGLAAAAVFLVLALIAVTDKHWFEAVAFGLLGSAFLVRHAPKFFVLRVVDPFALLALLIGLALFAYDAFRKLG
ncbi:MAG: hypothetical protein WD208_06640 [Dehalococcoidia bacterium]